MHRLSTPACGASRAHPFVRCVLPLALLVPGLAWGATPTATVGARWQTVANNGRFMPSATCVPDGPAPTAPPCRLFNSFNQPSVNTRGLVVFRARSKGGGSQGEPLHGVYTRDMAKGGPIVRILDRDTLVPQPNNRGTTFQETPSFPRIDMNSSTVATRGAHPPVWQVVNDAGEVVEQVGTNGVYANPFRDLVTAESRLGSVPVFSYFQVPERPGTAFDIVPGSPAITQHDIVVFKGNYTVGTTSKTGVYYRKLMNAPFPMSSGPSLYPASGTLPTVLIANTDSYIPGTSLHFGSTAPPSAAGNQAVFVGLDNEDHPTAGGIYLATLNRSQPPLKTLVRIGDHVPGEDASQHFTQIGEGLSFDGRFVAFWGAWGEGTQSLLLRCPQDGNADIVAYCNQQYPDGHAVQTPVHQGVFVRDLVRGRTWAIAKSPNNFTSFVYWNFSGHVPGSTTEEDGEPARWRSTAFVAVSRPANPLLASLGLFRAAFKASTGTLNNGAYLNAVDGIYLRNGPFASPLRTLAATGTDGTLLDPQAVDAETGGHLPITSLGIEREGLRGDELVINASMATDEAGWAGIYRTKLLW
ncbi:hypothetical protein ISP17_15240 [Dyella ginsengisoli]|uniref:DUF839 domain-containing protein n=1 Tax=Dyella ginsengisoli TaxID=363848 RepID=A0ABW8JYY8_9GAMM